mmetsp:Transcript_108658/g.324976  ORF Transcript_108658/g.324976 Transcript_108658/m.324976 type:complete len:243 (-) Transcript_108658:362-1090(-)
MGVEALHRRPRRCGRVDLGAQGAVLGEDADLALDIAGHKVLRALLRGHCEGGHARGLPVAAWRHLHLPVQRGRDVDHRAEELRDLLVSRVPAGIPLVLCQTPLPHGDLVHSDDAARIASGEHVLVVRGRDRKVSDRMLVARCEAEHQLAGGSEEPHGAVRLCRNEERRGHGCRGARGAAGRRPWVPQRHELDEVHRVLLRNDGLGHEIVLRCSGGSTVHVGGHLREHGHLLSQSSHMGVRQG